MTAVFADSHYFIALLNERDVHHPAAKDYSSEARCFIVTTRRVHGGSDALFDRGLALFRKRPDKNWSLTDCISFVVMSEEGLTEALTGDHHFEQAGFTTLLRGRA